MSDLREKWLRFFRELLDNSNHETVAGNPATRVIYLPEHQVKSLVYDLEEICTWVHTGNGWYDTSCGLSKRVGTYPNGKLYDLKEDCGINFCEKCGRPIYELKRRGDIITPNH